MIVDVPTGRQLSSGDTAKAAAVLEIAPPGLIELRFKPANERRYVGKSIPIADLDSIIRGEATYGTDPDRPTGASFPAVALTSTPEAAKWRISSPDVNEITLRPDVGLRLSSLLMVRDAVLAGACAAILPRSIIADAGRLVCWGALLNREVELWVLHPSRPAGEPQ